ncbi:MAG: diaminopimelate decarboxylase [Cellvibrionales bacterium TMED49]|nr:MAG: diaminopimelate decarboxylase [Cellvibrionales bacterium TMED49]
MSVMSRKTQQLWIEGVSITELTERYSTPCYIYSHATIKSNFLAYQEVLQGHKHLICFAVKANPNVAILQILARLGAGFDIVSVGELERVLIAGGDPKKIVFSGIGKTLVEMKRALEVGIHCFNVESEEELFLLNEVAFGLRLLAPISVRVNPDVDPITHPYISTGLKESKFGIDIKEAGKIYRQAKKLKNIRIIGVDCHIGSQITEIQPIIEALEHLIALSDKLKSQGIYLEHIDLGGGLGIRYENEYPPSIKAYLNSILKCFFGRNETLILEPGRSIVADAGYLVTRVQYLKNNDVKNYAIVDAGMNDMLRPALYQAWMDIQAVNCDNGKPKKYFDVVGPVCESSDFLGLNRLLSIDTGDLLCVNSAGAYGFAMSSNYNSRPRAAEVMVSGDKAYLVRERENLIDLTRGESLLPELILK